MSTDLMADYCQTPRGPWGTCIQALALGWILTGDLCPSCTRQFMAALDGISQTLSWGDGYVARSTADVAVTS